MIRICEPSCTRGQCLCNKTSQETKDVFIKILWKSWEFVGRNHVNLCKACTLIMMKNQERFEFGLEFDLVELKVTNSLKYDIYTLQTQNYYFD